MKYTVEEWTAFILGLCAWGSALRYWETWECEACGVRYHPRMGPPPPETVETTDTVEGCYHAWFNRVHAEWDYDRKCWGDD